MQAEPNHTQGNKIITPSKMDHKVYPNESRMQIKLIDKTRQLFFIFLHLFINSTYVIIQNKSIKRNKKKR